MPKLYAFSLSQPSRACLWFVKYAGLTDVEVQPVNILKGESRTPEYLAKFPAGHVPAVEDGDLRFAESTAILPYLAADHPILPRDKKELAKLHEYFGSHPATARKVTTDYLMPLVAAKSADEAASSKKACLDKIAPMLGTFDARLAKQAFIIGDKLSLADFLFATEVDQFSFIDPAVLEKHPHIAKYLERLRNDAAGYSENIDTAAGIFKGFVADRGY